MQVGREVHQQDPAQGRCRIRVYFPEDPVVICTELRDNPGQSGTTPRSG